MIYQPDFLRRLKRNLLNFSNISDWERGEISGFITGMNGSNIRLTIIKDLFEKKSISFDFSMVENIPAYNLNYPEDAANEIIAPLINLSEKYLDALCFKEI